MYSNISHLAMLHNSNTSHLAMLHGYYNMYKVKLQRYCCLLNNYTHNIIMTVHAFVPTYNYVRVKMDGEFTIQIS